MAESPWRSRGTAGGVLLTRDGSQGTGSRSPMSEVRVRATFSAERVWYTVKQKRREPDKLILKNVSLSAESGEVLAIMGPSGAGKTMLLNLLALVPGPGRRHGDVKLNGETFTSGHSLRYCAMVPQQDLHWAFLTCAQTLAIAASLHHPGNNAARIEQVLKKLGLQECARRRVGNAFVPGLAVGQRRRLSVAIALLKEPLLLFLDEPTTNLDSASAAGIMAHLKEVATDLEVIVVCTIHQPDWVTFKSFDKLLLLSSGKVAYQGRADKATEYFRALGRPVPPGVNPADYLLDLVNGSFTDPSIVASLHQAWSRGRSGSGSDASSAGVNVKSLPFRTPRGWFAQVSLLFLRHCLLLVRDPMLYAGRMFMILCLNLFFAINFIKSRDLQQSQVMNRMWLILTVVSVPGNLGSVASFALNQEFLNIRNEVRGGMYSLSAYLVATSIIQLFMMFVFSFVALVIPGYVLGQWNGKGVVGVLFQNAISLWCYECVAQHSSLSHEQPLVGMGVFSNYWFGTYLFSGLLLDITKIAWPLRILSYVHHLRYILPSIYYLEFTGVVVPGALPDDRQPRGFSCPGATNSVACWGHTGEQVLDSLGMSYPAIESEDHRFENTLITIGIGIAYKVLFFATALRWCKGVPAPLPPPPELEQAFAGDSGQERGEAEAIGRRAEGLRDVAALPDAERGATPPRDRLSGAFAGGVAPLAMQLAQPKRQEKEPRAVLSLQNGWFDVKGPRGSRVPLLKGVSISACSKELMAIMGPSGSGKSLLMSMLSILPGPGRRYGSLRLNGMDLMPSMFKVYGAQVLQQDLHWPFLTCREELQLAAHFYGTRLGDGDPVGTMLRMMGLEGCQHTRVGGNLVPGCSGGERRRMSVAMALMKEPLLLFIDEPTAGLDSAAAKNVMLWLTELTERLDMITICTLSQPSIEIFRSISQLVLLSEGAVAYSGAAFLAPGYFATIGFPIPRNANPAEYLVSFVNRGFTDSRTVDKVLSSWREFGAELLAGSGAAALPASDVPLPPPTSRPGMSRMWHLFLRQVSLTYRDPLLYLARLVLGLFCSLWFGLLYVNSTDERSQGDVLGRFYYGGWLSGVPTQFVAVAVFGHTMDIKLVLHESRNGMYGVRAYFFAQLVMQIPTLAVVCVGSFGVGGYTFGTMDGSKFFQVWLIYMLTYWVFESVGQCLAARPMHVMLNMMDYINFWFASFTYCGSFLRPSHAPWPFKALTPVLPLKYLYRSQARLEFIDFTYEGAVSSASAPLGYECPGRDPSACFGRTGCEVLESLGRLYEPVTCDDHYSQDVLILFLMVVFWKVVFLIALAARGTGIAAPGEVPEVYLKAIPPQEAKPAAAVSKKREEEALALMDVRGGSGQEKVLEV